MNELCLLPWLDMTTTSVERRWRRCLHRWYGSSSHASVNLKGSKFCWAPKAANIRSDLETSAFGRAPGLACCRLDPGVNDLGPTFVTELPASAFSPLRTWAMSQGRLPPVSCWRSRCTPSFGNNRSVPGLTFRASKRHHRASEVRIQSARSAALTLGRIWMS